MSMIIVAVDGSKHSMKALEITTLLAKSSKADVLVVHAVSNKDIPDEIRQGLETEYAEEIAIRLKSTNLIIPSPDETQYARTMLSHSKEINKVVNTLAGENILKRAISFLHENDIANVSTHLATTDAAGAIIETYKKHNADTIVMGCRGTGRLRGMVLGSVSQTVAHQADCSVVIVK